MTDRQLVTLILSGKTQLYSQIVDSYSAMVFAKAMGVVKCTDLATEISQQTFVRAYMRLAEWHGTESIAPWLATIAVRLSITYIDKARRRRSHAIEGDMMAEEYSTEHEHRLQRMEEAITQLGEPDKSIIHMHYYDNKSTADIAQQVGISQANVLVRLRRIRQQLKKQLENEKYK